MNAIRGLLIAFSLSLIATSASAQLATYVTGRQNGNGNQCLVGTDTTCQLPSSATSTVAVAGSTTTEAAGTITTHAVFQQALAASSSRKGCTIQNTSTDVEYVFFGATGSATVSNAFALGAASVSGGQGGSISCAIGGLGVATDNIAVTSKAADGATYVVSSQ